MTETNDKTTTKSKTKREKCVVVFQLFTALLIPVAIAVYTFVQNHNDRSIASANREKDLQIAREQRTQDLQLADDQQKANILASYEDFLVQHLNSYGMSLNGSQSARYVARLKTLTTVNQLDSTRKTFLLRVLFEANLITQNPDVKDSERSAIINLEHADLSLISFDNGRWKYLSLPESNLTRAKFTSSELSCSDFRSAILHQADLGETSVLMTRGQCFPRSPLMTGTSFRRADFYKARLSHVQYFPTDFSEAKLVQTDLSFFYCSGCLFPGANMSRSDLTRAEIVSESNLNGVDFTETNLHLATFRFSTFFATNFRRTSGIRISCESCLFHLTTFIDNQFLQSSFLQSNFSNLIINGTNFTGSKFINSTFSFLVMFKSDLTDVQFIQSTFINVKFDRTRVFNRQFVNCLFQNTSVDD